MDSAIDLGRPTSGDVVDLILEDHDRFERLLRQLRSTASDRDAVRQAFAALHVAHAEAEEKHVYPRLKKASSVTKDEAEHGEHEHAEGNEALLAVLECAGTDTQKFDDAVEELARAIVFHGANLSLPSTTTVITRTAIQATGRTRACRTLARRPLASTAQRGNHNLQS